MNRDPGKPIAEGRTAILYAWQDDQVLKLFHDWFSLENIEYEARINRIVHDAGLPVPTVGEIVRVNDHNGLTYQRFDGVNMWEMVRQKPWKLFHFARLTAELQAQVHDIPIQADLPTYKERLERDLQEAPCLASPLRSRLLDTLNDLPGGDRLCHGDFHPGNILVSARGAIVLDWITACLGDPLADVARTSIILLGSAASSQAPHLYEKVMVRILHAVYLRRYFQLRPGNKDRYRRWLPIVAAGRLREDIPELKDYLLEEANKIP